MGVLTKAITFIGKEFRNESEGLTYFKSKVELNEKDLDEMGPHLHYWLDARQKKGFPQCGYYIGYNVYDINPDKMQQKIATASIAWKNMFKGKAEIYQAVLYT